MGALLCFNLSSTCFLLNRIVTCFVLYSLYMAGYRPYKPTIAASYQLQPDSQIYIYIYIYIYPNWISFNLASTAYVLRRSRFDSHISPFADLPVGILIFGMCPNSRGNSLLDGLTFLGKYPLPERFS